MKRKQILLGILVVISLVITGFRLYDDIKRSLPITCEEILEPQLSQIPRSNITATSVQQWFAEQYGVSKDKVYILPDYPAVSQHSFGVRWESAEKWYEAVGDERSGQLWYVDVDWKTRIPQLSQVLSCNSDPTYYTLQKLPHDLPFNLQLGLWYPQKGFIVTAWNGDTSSINGQAKIDKLRLLGPFDISDTKTLSNMEYLLVGKLRSGSIKKWSGLDNLIPEDLFSSK